jgi:hypothetical protein
MPHDQRMRQHVIRSGGTKHGLHALLTLFTCGLWAPVWLLAALFTPKKTVVPEPSQFVYPPMPPGQQNWPPRP